jgi:hypothetical protein
MCEARKEGQARLLMKREVAVGKFLGDFLMEWLMTTAYLQLIVL